MKKPVDLVVIAKMLGVDVADFKSVIQSIYPQSDVENEHTQ